MDCAASMVVGMGFCSSNSIQLNISSNTRNLKPCNPQFQTPITTRSRRRSRSNGRSRYSSGSTTTYYALLSETSAAAISEPETVNITWQIVVGALAGITPFTVAGIEFSKRIVKQRQCEACNGSGLVLTADKNYVKCPACDFNLFLFYGDPNPTALRLRACFSLQVDGSHGNLGEDSSPVESCHILHYTRLGLRTCST